MADSDDDWFEKDVDEMVQQVQKRTSQVETEGADQQLDLSGTSNSMLMTPTMFTDPDYGGNYKIASRATAQKNATAKQRNNNKKVPHFQTISGKMLQFILDLDPIEAFLQIYQISCFYESLEETPKEHVGNLIAIFAKLCELPFQEYGKDFLPKVLNCQSILSKCEAHVKAPKCSKEFIDRIVSISGKAQSLGLANETLVKLLTVTKSRKDINLKHKMEIESLLKTIEEDKDEYQEIYPTLDDVKSNEPAEVKPNIIKGSYESVQDYVQTHLSLLREDFVSPLREFVNELKAFASIENVPYKRVYKAARILLNDKLNRNTSRGLAFLVDLKPNERNSEAMETKKTPWINPKKLMFGTLLCFSSSLDFTDLILAVVSHRDNEMLATGYIYVELLKIYNVATVFNRDFIMFESEVYFEPYHHVYRVLRGLREHNFPLKNYIVKVEQNTQPPDYLQGETKYNYKYKKYNFNPLVAESYPPAETLNLNDSQYVAYQQALSRKFSLIQGPPGTGKTFIGLKIVSTLLENIDSSILIVCYTNHALDQFLSEILQYTKDIVRLGSQSKHELLDEYNIKQIADNVCSSRNLKSLYYNAKMEHTKLLEDFEKLQKKSEGQNTEAVYQEVLQAQEKLRQSSGKLSELKQMFDYKLIKGRKVIGMTTTYASRSNLLLQLIKTPIVIVEEAAEVLEPHIIATLTQSTEHVVLIGDHQQLRPTTSSYRLSQKFQMDISLFERLVNNNLNCSSLNIQHRMRPEIASLLRPTIYKDYRDALNVFMYPDIRGVSKNLFFVNHNFQETKSSDETTKRNPHEVQFLLALANYLLMKGYEPQDIVILCTYNGQMFDFFNERKNHPRLEKVRITVVDNFQGEESKIILLSLVRNNANNRIGYLAMKNRICVALSRAQEGFYVSGAINFLARNNSTWQNIKFLLETQNSIGDELPLLCHEHGTITKVSKAEDFKLVTSTHGCGCDL